MRVLVVDDSVVFRSQIKSALEENSEIVVVAVAANGKIALEKIEQNVVDVVILDLEMPVMDGMQTLEEMRKRNLQQKVIIFAAPTGEGIDLAFRALKAGASDFIAKPASTTGSLEEALDGIKKELIPKVLQFKGKLAGQLNQEKKISSPTYDSQKPIPKINLSNLFLKKPKIIGIGSSTGGPNALEIVLSPLKGNKLNAPILIAQHMPPKFTEALAERIQFISGHPCFEGKQGELISPGRIYIAPGDYHMTVEKRIDGNNYIRLDQGPKRNSVRPAVDNLFESLSAIYGNGCTVFVLTGMGEDGMVGAQAVKSIAGTVIIQDQASSTVWGMPGAVYASGHFDIMSSVEECGQFLLKMVE
ncbi:chemotaxis-specific protein-glutamate methyltransferase CheB [Pigmentibacter sp. JX0631]|uniref:chemotaxis-specific protein-glutamate methyltransferase CheB n=1 Tax=Pigmentibacter sp. JX0631 TaxID=2976982 RepID=UPI002468BE91|nr:chemotaxis-specific protein-glutamate methyltransferase CheB [Pigmentibacter sp. JX0631]WGL59131.1 chemotaxis-specific protein-glutamate methyltransferase CheB [Pigmentibacter sp. JX0631]